MASSLNNPFLLFIALIFFHLSCNTALEFRSLILSVRKDTITRQYYASIDIFTPSVSMDVVIDLGGISLWFDCDVGYNSSTYRKVSCGSNMCKQANGIACMGCNSSPRLGCTNNTCGKYLNNPYMDVLVQAALGEDIIHVYQTDGLYYSSSALDLKNFPFSCTSSFNLEGLAKGTKGMLGLSRAQIAMPTKLTSILKLPRIFAICVPSSTKNGLGHIFIGGGPYIYPPYIKDMSKELIETPLLINPVSTAPIYGEGEPSDEYFIDVKSIKVGGETLQFNISLLSMENKEGVGGTKLSTTTPYTVLHSSIYKALVDAFVKKAASIGMKRVASVKKFGACFSSNSISSDKHGRVVPIIDLVLQNDSVYWRILGSNSMVKVSKNVFCLGFVDGGSAPRTSIVIGGRQLEDNLVEFDIDSSKLRFSSSLSLKNTSCSHYRIF